MQFTTWPFGPVITIRYWRTNFGPSGLGMSGRCSGPSRFIGLFGSFVLIFSEFDSLLANDPFQTESGVRAWPGKDGKTTMVNQ